MASKKNDSPVDPNVPHQNGNRAHVPTIDESDYQDVQVGFAPYFAPSEGAKFHGRLLDADATDPKFIRFTFEALSEIECFTGPKDEQESVIVRPGEVFTVSAFAQIHFEQYGGMKMIVEFKEKVKTSTVGRSVWLMGLKLHKDDYAIVQARRNETMAARVERATQLRAEVEAALKSQKLQQPQAINA